MNPKKTLLPPLDIDNYIALRVLEKLDIHAPNEEQIQIIEALLTA